MDIEAKRTKVEALRAKAADLLDRADKMEKEINAAVEAMNMKFIRKHKISPEKLSVLDKLSEDEINLLLAGKEESALNKAEEKKELMENENEKENY